MQVAIELNVELAARLAVEPVVHGMSVADAILFLANQALQALDNERDPELFAQRCAKVVEGWTVGQRYHLYEAVPRGEGFDSRRLKAVAKMLHDSPLVEMIELTDAERNLRKRSLLRVEPPVTE